MTMTSAPERAALKVSNVFWLLAAMAFVLAPHADRLPLWVTTSCVAAGVARGCMAWYGWKTPHSVVMALLAIGATAGTWLVHGRLYGRDPSSTLLIVMLCLKLLEMRSRRDALLTVFLGFFLVFINFLYSQTVAMGAYMLLCLWLFVATLVGFNRIGSDASLKERLVPAGLMLLQAIPLMLVIFVLFPRISTPLWRLPQDANSGQTGLSDSMAPGDVNKLSKSDKVAFRADFHGNLPAYQLLYWRGPVLWDFDGRTWRMSPVAGTLPTDRTGIESRSRGIDYTVTLEPHGKTWLFALDMPVSLPPDSRLMSDYQLRSTTPVNTLRRYEVRSTLAYEATAASGEFSRKRALGLPPASNPRAVAYAQKLRADFPDNQELIRNTLRLFNTQFVYTLEPPLLGDQAVDEFLFDTRRGFCEHYASSFVFLMRAAGVPARVVTGYQGGEVNDIGAYLIVRQADAHAWAEVWLEGQGWVRVDPTAAVAPNRIEQGIDLTLGPVNATDYVGAFKQVRLLWDSVNNQWNQWVIGYNTERQSMFLQQFGIDGTDWRKVAMWLLIGSLGTGGMVAMALIWRLRNRPRDPALLAYERFTAKLGKAGIVRQPHEGPVAFLQRVSAEQPALAPSAEAVTQLYVDLRYASDVREPEQLAALKRAVATFQT